MNKRMAKYVRIKTGEELYCHCQPRHQVLQLCCSHPEAAWQKYIKLVSLEKLRIELLQIFAQMAQASQGAGLPDSRLGPWPIFFFHITGHVAIQRLKEKPGGRELLIFRFFHTFLRIKFISLILACV